MSTEYKVYVGNLPYSTDEDELANYFADCLEGDQEIVSRIIIKENGRSRGFGFVAFSHKEAMERAVNKKDKLNDRELRISVAQERKPRERRPH